MSWESALSALAPTSWYKLAGNINDSGTGGITGTAVGSPSYVPSLIPQQGGAASQAIQLNGTTQYFHLGDNYDLNGVDFTIGCWIKVESANFGSGFQRVWEKRDSGGTNQGFINYGQGAGNLTWDWDFGATVEGMATLAGLDQDEVHFIVYTFVSSTERLACYVDGSEVEAKDSTGWTDVPWSINNPGNFVVGASTTAGNLFQGTIDDFFIKSGTAWDASTINNLWTEGTTVAGAAGNRMMLLGIG